MEENIHYHPITEQDIDMKILTIEEILTIYTSHSVRHFPENERKPVSSIRRMAAEGIYTGYGLYLHENPAGLLGYAFFTVLSDQNCCLLDYFAIMENYRSHGIGSLFLKYIKTSFQDIPGFLIESEDPDYAENASEYSIRCKRLAFYERNGAAFTGIRASVFGVPYRLLFFPLHTEVIPAADAVHSDFCSIYRRMVSPKSYETQIYISLPEKRGPSERAEKDASR